MEDGGSDGGVVTFWNSEIPEREAGSGSHICCRAFLVEVTCTGSDVNGYARMTSSSVGDSLGVIRMTPAMSMLWPVFSERALSSVVGSGGAYLA